MPKEWLPENIDLVTWDLRYSDFPRAKRRAQINSLFNGVPPYTEKEVEQNNITINVNDLSGTREAHNARAQFYSAFMKPGSYFDATTDWGPVWQRGDNSRTVSTQVGKIMKKDLRYFETHRSKWASTVLHGISPCVNQNADSWCPRPIGIDDVLIPANTELMMDDLPFFAIYRQFTAPQLIKLAKAPLADPGWNQPLIDACLKWIDTQTLSLTRDYWPDVWQPEKWQERIKGDGTYYAADRVPTINVWDFYYWEDSAKNQCWNRRMILDAWSMPDGNGIRQRRTEEPFSRKSEFLFKADNWASSRQEIINWQFADLSAVAPFRYHSIRSLGFLLYSVCHLQNRLRCKFNEAVFEQLMVYFRVKTADDMQTALSVNLVDRVVIDDSIQFIPAQERYQVNMALAQLGLAQNDSLITRNSSTYTSKLPSTEKVPTATQWMGEEQKVTQLVSAGLMQAYEYQKGEYQEIFRRFLKKNSRDPAVRKFQDNCLRRGVPEKVLYEYDCWNIEPNRIFGSGNKTLEMMVANQLMQYRNLYDPDSQRKILRDFTLAVTDDAAKTADLVPDQPQPSNSIFDAQQSVGTLLLGQPMEFREKMNHSEYAAALLNALDVEIQKINSIGGIPESQSEILGLQNLAGMSISGEIVPGNGAANHIQLVAQDPEQKQLVKTLTDQLSKSMNQVKAFDQRLQEKQSQGNGGMDPEMMVKMQKELMAEEQRNKERATAHAQRTAQRQIAFEMEQERENKRTLADIAREDARFSQEMTQEAAKAQVETKTAPSREE